MTEAKHISELELILPKYIPHPPPRASCEVSILCILKKIDCIVALPGGWRHRCVHHTLTNVIPQGEASSCEGSIRYKSYVDILGGRDIHDQVGICAI